MDALHKRLGRVLVPLLTPFDEREEVDLAVLERLVHFVVANGYADSLVVAGTTGEFYALTRRERITLLGAAKEIVEDRLPIIAGTGAASTRETIALTCEAEKLGYDCVTVVSPYYQKATQEGLYRHFKAVAESTSLPVMLYNIPLFTGVNVEVETFARLVRVPNIRAIKEQATMNPTQMAAFAAAAPRDFSLYCADDTMVLQTLPEGGVGVVSGGSHVIGDLMHDMIAEYLEGRVADAATRARQMMPLFRAFGDNGRANPVPLLKEAFRLHSGIDVGKPRMPSVPATGQETEGLREALRALGKLSDRA